MPVQLKCRCGAQFTFDVSTVGAILCSSKTDAYVAELTRIREWRNTHAEHMDLPKQHCLIIGCYSAESIYHNPGFGGPPFA